MTTFNKQELATKFALVKNVIAKTSTLNHLTMMHFVVDKNKFKLTGSNGEIQVTATGECSGDESFNVCVPPGTFNIMLGSAKNDINIKVKDLMMSTLSAKSKFNIPAIDGDMYPLLKMEGKVTPFNLKELIGSVYRSSSKNAATINMCGTCVQIKDNTIHAIATDAGSMFINRSEINHDNINIIIPNFSAEYLASTDTDGFMVSDKSLKATSSENGIELICKLIDAVFPPWERIVSTYEKSFTVEIQELIDSLSTVNKIENILSVNLKSENGVLVISAREGSGSSFSNEIEFKGDDVDISANPAKLLACLNAVDCVIIKIGFDTNKGFQSMNGSHMFLLSRYKK